MLSNVAARVSKLFINKYHKHLFRIDCRKFSINKKGKSASRQQNDHLVHKARNEKLRSRAAFKLREINDKFKLISQRTKVIDLGAAPGGWSQVAAKLTKEPILAVDLLKMEPLKGVDFIQGDFRQLKVREQIQSLLQRKKANVVLSDMAPSLTGQLVIDQAAQWQLCHNALRLSRMFLHPQGHFVTKIFMGEGAEDFRQQLKKDFEIVTTMKPASSRSESSEMYFIAQRFCGK